MKYLKPFAHTKQYKRETAQISWLIFYGQPENMNYKLSLAEIADHKK